MDLQQRWQDQLPGAVLRSQKTDADNPDIAVAETLGLMASHAARCAGSPQVARAVAAAWIKKSDSLQAKLQKIFSYIKNRVQFVEDDDQLANIFVSKGSRELLIAPDLLLSMKQPKGDCDDFSMLACSMCKAVGISCDFVTVAADFRSNEFSHVYCMVAGDIPFDASHGKFVGWETNRNNRKTVWPNVLSDMKGEGNMLGDLYSDAGVDPGYSGTQEGTIYSGAASGPGIDWGAILAGAFGASEKIAIQTTQKPGYQTTGPNGQTVSYVLPNGATSAGSIGLPGLGGSSSLMPLLLIGGLLIAGVAVLKGLK